MALPQSSPRPSTQRSSRILSRSSCCPRLGPAKRAIAARLPYRSAPTDPRRRLISSTQVRKIRCDRLPAGCSPCLRKHTECRTTDRITGRVTSRGCIEGLDQQNRDLRSRIEDLEKRLIRNGIDVKPSNGCQHTPASSYDYHAPSSNDQAASWNAYGAPYSSQPGDTLKAEAPQEETDLFHALPSSCTGCTSRCVFWQSQHITQGHCLVNPGHGDRYCGL
jgi:hypothetical protein